MNAIPVEQEDTKKRFYKLGYRAGINFVAKTIIEIMKGNEFNTKDKLNMILEFLENSIKANDENIKKESNT